MWKTHHGKVWHRFEDCKNIKSSIISITPNVAKSVHQCKWCITRATCDICMVDNARMPLCNLHVACEDCFAESIKKSFQCPFEGNQLTHIPHKFLNNEGSTIQYVCPIEYTIDNILTLKCPACKQAFYDFDACLYLNCSKCNKSFCGFCFQIINNHNHLLSCPERPDNCDGYFMNIDDWHEYQHIKKTNRIPLFG